jgi:hypothetical protein
MVSHIGDLPRGCSQCKPYGTIIRGRRLSQPQRIYAQMCQFLTELTRWRIIEAQGAGCVHRIIG